ncbi:hypothetical protein KCU93_g76, partial [Aureobasidium melanogenum]
LPLSRKRDCARVKSCKSTPSRDDLTNSGHSAADELPVEARDISLHRCDGFQNLLERARYCGSFGKLILSGLLSPSPARQHEQPSGED